MIYFRVSVAAILVLIGTPPPVRAVDYLRDIKPLLAEKCVACHGTLNQESGLRLDYGEYIRQGSEQGAVVNLAHPNKSELILRVGSEDESLRMPPEGEGEALTVEQIQLLLDWIRWGAKSPDDEPRPVDPTDHWAWQPLERPKLPADVDPSTLNNPIDAFVFSRLRRLVIQPARFADPETLLRRVYFDLIGLPPTVDQQQRFLQDRSKNAWAKLVDRLLSDPAHGERWARHWMDVWRYSDWAGYKDEVRGSQRHIWRWRDWIIDSLNADKGYDQMIVEMLAGDEIAPDDTATLRATGFLARNFHNSNRNIWLDATVEHTAKAFLALTINCARCHDHKYDPLSQHEYYAFRAIFEPHHVRTERLPGQSNLKQHGLVRAYDAKPDEPTYLYISGDEKKPDQDHVISANVPSIFERPLQVAPVALPHVAIFPTLRPYIQQEDLARARRKVEQAKARAQELENPESEIVHQQVKVAVADLESLEARWKADKARYADDPNSLQLEDLVRNAVLAEHAAQVASARLTVLQKQKDVRLAESSEGKDNETANERLTKARKALIDAEKALDAAIAEPAADAEYTAVGKVYPARSTGRRLALARWIASPENPLTARVAVNYLWMHHFGEPLVANVFDFGLRSPTPAHVELLDWLSVELIENRWSFKHLHRLIVNSRVYRLSSEQGGLTERHPDPNNALWWRANVRRLEAEAIRDSLLHAAANLDRTLGGPDIDFQAGETVPRRSVYFRHAYEKQMQMLVMFDAAAPNECYRRSPSVIPQQALALANSPLSFDQARQLAGRLHQKLPDGPAASFIQAAFRTILGRDGSPQEQTACDAFLRRQQAIFEQQRLTPLQGSEESQIAASDDPAQRARESLVHALFNHNDFITIR